MDSLKVNFGNAANWEHISDDTTFARIINSDPPSHDPIPDQIVSIQISSPTILVYCSTENPKPRWKFAGNCQALVYTGVSTGGQNLSVIGSLPLFLNQKNICRFPSLSDQYSIKFKIPIWFKSFYYSLWEYTGSGVGDTEGKIDAVFNEIKLGT